MGERAAEDEQFMAIGAAAEALGVDEFEVKRAGPGEDLFLGDVVDPVAGDQEIVEAVVEGLPEWRVDHVFVDEEAAGGEVGDGGAEKLGLDGGGDMVNDVDDGDGVVGAGGPGTGGGKTEELKAAVTVGEMGAHGLGDGDGLGGDVEADAGEVGVVVGGEAEEESAAAADVEEFALGGDPGEELFEGANEGSVALEETKEEGPLGVELGGRQGEVLG